MARSVARVPESDELDWRDPEPLTVWDEGDDPGYIGTILGPDGEPLVILRRVMGYGRR